MKVFKTIICLLISTVTYFSNAQNMKEIDSQFLSHNKEQNVVNEYLNVFVSSKDCYRCFAELHQILMQIEKVKPNLQVNFITDQVVFAKKETKDYLLKKRYFVNKEIFNEQPKSFYYLKQNNEIIEGRDKIISSLKNDATLNSDFITNLKVKDSLFTSTDIYHAGLFNNDLLVVYDKSVDLGGIINVIENKIDYYNITTVSKKLYNLPFTLELKDFELINYESFSKLKKDFRIPEIKTTIIYINEDIVYTNFVVSRLFKDLKTEGDVGLFSFNYIAVKQIKDKNKLAELFDIETYDSFFSVDHLDFNAQTYRLGKSIYFPFSNIIDKHHFVTKVFYKTDFAGEATSNLLMI